jgi:hypothetical protein
MCSNVYELLSHLRDEGGVFSGRLKYIIKNDFWEKNIILKPFDGFS